MKNQQFKSGKSDQWSLWDYKPLKVIIQNETFADFTDMERKTRPRVQKLNKFEYLDIETNEIKKYNLSEKKTNIESLKKTFKRLMYLIRHNFTEDSENQLFITLTYAKNMKDKDKLYSDYDKFYKKLKRKLKDIKLDYIAVAEPQERGAWHMHIMLKGDKKIFIKNEYITELWGEGITDTQRLKSTDVGAYYVSYFTNLEVEAKDGEKGKKYKKGARLKYYPSGMKLYRSSRGIEKPPTKEMTWEELVKEFGEPVWRSSYEIIKVTGKLTETVNKIHKASFKKKKGGV